MTEQAGTGSRFRWLGPTPALVVWRLHHSCPLLDHFARFYRRPRQPLAVHQLLKPLAAISEAAQRQALVAGWAVLLPADPRVLGNERDRPLAFRVDDATQAFGGTAAVRAACGPCLANVGVEGDSPDGASSSASLAGCSQVMLMGSMEQFSQQTRRLGAAEKPMPLPPWKSAVDEFTASAARGVAEALFAAGHLRRLFQETSPHRMWQRLWHRGQASGVFARDHLLALLADARIAGLTRGAGGGDTEPLTGWYAFCEAARRSVAAGSGADGSLDLETEFVPRGFADGHVWWWGPQCGGCGAELESSARQCPVCGQACGPIPPQKRKIMGWAPYRPVDSLLNPAAAAALIAAATGQRPDND